MSQAAPTHSDLLGAYIELQGDLAALRARFALSGLELLAFLEDPAISQPLPTHTPIKAPNSPLIKVVPHFALLVNAGQAPVARASSP
ncbi:MAG: hypothetical protein AABZ53_04690 [Planctomycetota bacterium]